MTLEPNESAEAPLRPDEVAELRHVLGRPTPGQVDRAIEEVERQVAVEDLVVLLVESVTESARAFFDFLIALNRDTTSTPAPNATEEDES